MTTLRNVRQLKSLKTPAAAAIRQYSAAAAAEASRDLAADGQLKISTLDNGVRVASLDTGGAVSRLSLWVNAGSREEAPSNLGITHLMKNASFSSSGSRSAVKVTRDMQSVGGSFDAAHTREFLSRNAVFLRGNLQDVLENVTADITSPLIEPWDLKAIFAKSKLENGALAADGIAENLEQAHKVAFRTGLGNSLFCSNVNMGGFSAADLNTFAAETYVGRKTTIVGTDCDHNELTRCVQDLMSGLAAGATTHHEPAVTVYSGGTAHVHTSNGLAHVSVTAPGAGLFSQDLAAFSVLQYILGTAGSFMKWGSNTVSSRLNAAAQSAASEGAPLLINSVNINYSDAGLFGVYAIASPADIAAVAKAAMLQIQAVASGEVSAEELVRAKNQASHAAAEVAETKSGVVDDLAKQIMFTGALSSSQQAAANIAAVTAADVERVAASLTANPTLVATGNTSQSPYLDQII